jgi:predicted Rossmann-fold nucleotide-binding protein
MLPGGIGTLEEFFEIWVGRKLGYHSKPVVVCDPFGTYEMLQTSLDYLSQEEFIGATSNELVAWCRDIPSAIRACKP